MPRLLSGCLTVLFCMSALAAPIPKGAGMATIYFPTTVDAKWVYEREGPQDESVVVSAVEKDGDDLIVSRKGVDGTQTIYAKMVVSTEGLRQVRELTDGKVGWVLKTKLKSGDSWEVPDGGKRTVHGPEDIEVPAGKFKALRVVWESDGRTLTSWYAPGVGEVKRVEKFGDEKERMTRLLKSFKLKNEKK